MQIFENIRFKGDLPQPRFGHTITPYTADKFCLFGGALGQINNMTMTDKCYSVNMQNLQWQRILTTGVIPSARGGHAAACVQKNKIVIYGGATQKGLASDQLYILDIKQDVGIWNIVKINHRTPGKRYGHTMVHIHPYLVIFGGNLENKVVNDLWVLNIQSKKPEWCEVNCKGDIPSPRDYHSATLCQSGQTAGMMIIFGGRSANKNFLNDCWGLVRHSSTGLWDWNKAPNISNTQRTGRYQHTSLFIQNLMFVIGGRSNNKQTPLQVFDTASNKWLSFPLADRFRHVSWSYNNTIYLNGGLQKSTTASQQTLKINLKHLKLPFNQQKQMQLQIQIQNLNKSTSYDFSTKLVSSSYSNNPTNRQQSFQKQLEQVSPLSPIFKKQQKTKLIQRQRQSRLNVSSSSSNMSKSKKKVTILQPVFSKRYKQQIKKTLPIKQNIANYFLEKLLRPHQFTTQKQFSFLLNSQHIITLCDVAEQIIASQPMLLNVRAPCKIFGDIHGQYLDLMDFFKLYGSPYENGQRKDIQNYDYIFLGDYVDRGSYSIQTICMLLSLKVMYPNQVHLLRGNHEDAACNFDFGFLEQCQMKLDQDGSSPNSVYARINSLFQWLPLAAVAEQKILCVHGGIGKGLQKVQQILQIKRPLTIMHEVVDKQSQIVIDILWSDPTESDQVNGIYPNIPRDPRGLGDIVRFGPDRVKSFLKNNNLNLIVRAHECVMDGIQRFAGGSLITVFSATDYGQKHKNAGGMLVLKTNLQIVPKIIYPKQKNVQTWLQQQDNSPKRPLTPPRWRKFN